MWTLSGILSPDEHIDPGKMTNEGNWLFLYQVVNKQMTVIQRVNLINWDNFHFQDFSTLSITTRQSPLLQSSASKLKLNIKVQMTNLEWANEQSWIRNLASNEIW